MRTWALPEERQSVADQIEDGYGHLRLLSVASDEPADEGLAKIRGLDPRTLRGLRDLVEVR